MSRELTEVRVRELAREEIRAAAQRESKPVLTEWRWREALCTLGGECRTVSEDANWYVARVHPDGSWHVWSDKDHMLAEGRSGGHAAADAWIRANPDKVPAALPPAPVQPVAPRELTDKERCADCGKAAVMTHQCGAPCCHRCHVAYHLMAGSGCAAWAGRKLLAEVTGEATDDDGTDDSGGAYGQALNAIQEARGYCSTPGIAWLDEARACVVRFAEIRARPPAVPQPAPGATVDEVMAAVKPSWEGAVDRLRRALSTLSPAQLRGMVDAIGGGK